MKTFNTIVEIGRRCYGALAKDDGESFAEQVMFDQGIKDKVGIFQRKKSHSQHVLGGDGSAWKLKGSGWGSEPSLGEPDLEDGFKSDVWKNGCILTVSGNVKRKHLGQSLEACRVSDRGGPLCSC